MDINFFFKFNDINIDKSEIGIAGYIVNYDFMKYFDDYDFFEEYLEYYSPRIEGKYDPCTKSALISFDNSASKEESYKEDIYYLFKFSPGIYMSKFSVEIFIDSKKESHSNLPKNKYIRGSFNIKNKEIQTKTFSIEFNEKYNFNLNDTYILEFSSNLEDIKPIFNKEFNYTTKRNIGGVDYYYFPAENLYSEYKYNFTIQFNNTIDNDKIESIDIFRYLANYIIKFYKEENNQNLDFLTDKSFDKTIISRNSKNLTNYNFTIKPKNVIMNLNYSFNYSYYIRLYSKESIFQPQILKSTAFIFTIYYGIEEYKTDNPNEEIKFSFGYFGDNKDYYFCVFIKVNAKANEEKYFSINFELPRVEENQETGKYENNKKPLIILSIIFGSIIIIILIISIVVCIRFKKKNKNLKEQVQAISFSRGIDEDNIKKMNNKISKEDEDYENTFI